VLRLHKKATGVLGYKLRKPYSAKCMVFRERQSMWNCCTFTTASGCTTDEISWWHVNTVLTQESQS